MPKKKNSAGNMQEYLPAGSEEHGGEYAKEDGTNAHYFAHFKKQVEGEVTGTSGNETIQFSTPHVKKDKTQVNKEPNTIENDLIEDEEDVISEQVEQEETDILPHQALNPKISKKVKAMDDTDCYDYLLGFEGEFDQEKIKKLSSQELHNLVTAKLNSDYFSDIDTQLKKELNEVENEGPTKLWNNIPQTLEALEQSLQKKQEYVNSLTDEDKIAELEVKIAKAQKILSEWKADKNKSLLDGSNALLEKYLNPDNPYSQKAKDNAVWIKSEKEAMEYFKDIQKTYDKIPKSHLNKIIDYTTSYSWINEPLRKISYLGGHDSAKFVETVEQMTSALDLVTLKDDMWLQRGVGNLFIDGKNLYDFNLNDLVGKVYEDQAFVSCSAHKGGGFDNKKYILNIYAPKGTKGLYINPISNYQGKEDETLLQRGYSYRITKVEKGKGSDSHVYLDVEVILGSDSKKYNSEELKQLKKEKF